MSFHLFYLKDSVSWCETLNWQFWVFFPSCWIYFSCFLFSLLLLRIQLPLNHGTSELNLPFFSLAAFKTFSLLYFPIIFFLLKMMFLGVDLFVLICLEFARTHESVVWCLSSLLENTQSLSLQILFLPLLISLLLRVLLYIRLSSMPCIFLLFFLHPSLFSLQCLWSR